MKGPGILIVLAIGVLLWWEPGLVGLRVAQVEVVGQRHLSPALTESLANPYIGKSMGISTCRSLEGVFAQHPLVKTARTTRVWPDTLQLLLEEKRLVARTADSAMVFDILGNGYRSIGAVSDSLPKLSGWTEHDQKIWAPIFGALGVVQEEHPTLFWGASVHAAPTDNSFTIAAQGSCLNVVLPCPADDGLGARLEYLPIVLADARSNGELPTSVDLRWANQIVLGVPEIGDMP